MMTSFLIAEEERVTAKNSKQAESPACIKNKTHLRTSLQFHDLQLHNQCYPRSQQDVNAPSKFYSYKGTVFDPS